MTIANTFAAKLSVAFVAIAMALMMFAPAKAQTTAELQAQITSLMATINALQAQLGTAAPTMSMSAYVFTRSLTVGAQGADVTALQQYLIGAGYSIPAGATGYFGSQTKAAVAAWQAANGVTPAVGYFGPISQAKYTAMMAAMTPTTPTGTGSSTTGTGTGSTVTLNGGEASIDSNYNAKSGDDTDLQEGQVDAPVMDVQFDVKDGDIQINRMDVATTFVSGDETDPWNVYQTVSLWVNGDKIASIDGSVKANWEKDQPNPGDYRLRFNGLNQVFREGDKATITVGVTLQGSIGNHTGSWKLFVPENGIRGVDGAGIQEYTGSNASGDKVTFSFAVKGNTDEVIVKSASTNPSATTLALKTNATTDWTTIMAYDLDTKDSVNDISLSNLPVGLVVSADNIDKYVQDVRLVVDGVTYTDYTNDYADPASSVHANYNFDINDDTVIKAGDRITVQVQVKFKQLANADQGTTIYATSTASMIKAEGAKTLTTSNSQLTGAVTGELMTLRTAGAVFSNFSSTQSQTQDPNSTTANTGVFTIKFDVTAFNTDVYVAKSAASGTVMTAGGVNFKVENGAGTQVGTPGHGTSTAALASTASTDTTSGKFVVHEGETKTFTLSVTYDPDSTNYYQVQLYALNFATTNTGAATVQQMAIPQSSYVSGQVSVSN